MATVNLQAIPRQGTGKGAARKLRVDESVPAVLYGYGIDDPTSLTIDHAALRKALGTSAGSRGVIKLDIEGDSSERAAIVKEIQRHPVSRKIIHLDLFSIDLTQPVEVAVPVRGVGTPTGVKFEDGVLGWARRELQIRVLPTRIPESIEIDISDLHVNQVIHIGDVELEEGMEHLEDAGLTVCSVSSTRLEIVEDEEEGDEDDAAEATEVGEDEPAEGSED